MILVNVGVRRGWQMAGRRWGSSLEVPRFEASFPTLLDRVRNFNQHVKFGVPRKEFMQMNKQFHSSVLSELQTAMPAWRTLQTMNDERICYHILRVLYCFLNSEDYATYSSDERNLMYWVVMLHDICKRGLPKLPVPKDPFHPFASAAYALPYLAKLSRGEESLVAKAESLSAKIRVAKYVKEIVYFEMHEDRYNSAALECSNLNQLGTLLNELDTVFPPHSFHHNVVKLVLMHSCIPTLQHSHIDNQLASEDVHQYIDTRFFRYFKTFAICDSESYLLNAFRHLIPVYRNDFHICFRRYEARGLPP
jgi:hypothetical protein